MDDIKPKIKIVDGIEEEKKEKKVVEETSKMIPDNKKRNKLLLAACLAIAIVVIALVYYLVHFIGLKNNVKDTASPAEVAVNETADLIAKVGKLLLLPEGEMPTIATVSDPEKLKGEPFFANAKTGDKVLLYTVAKKAILYDPTQNLIVEVAPLNINSAPATTTKIKK